MTPLNEPPVSVEERLFSLVLALLATHHGLTKSDVLSSVQGYRQRYAVGGNNSSLERQFERDKDDLRDLGIPLETVEPFGDEGNNQLVRYRISKGEYDLPAELTFEPDEIAILSLAATVWRQGSMSRESQRALMKLRSLGIEPDESVIGYAPRVRTRENSFEPLKTALDRRLTVKFLYLRGGAASPRLRTVEPLALVQHHGRWLLYGHDSRVNAARTFLLSRIVGDVAVTGSRATVSAEGAADRALGELDALWNKQSATVRAEPGTEAHTRLTKRAVNPGEIDLVIPFTDRELLADELAGFGPEVVVLGPTDVREAVMGRLRQTLETHADPSPTPAEHSSAQLDPATDNT